jgi:hypothetical protein
MTLETLPTHIREHWWRGVWAWFCPVYTASFVLLRCDAALIPEHVRREIPDRETQDVAISLFADTADAGPTARFAGVRSVPYGPVVVIWLHPQRAGIAILAHELLHAVSWVLNAKGLPLTDASEEAYTYYLEWLMRESLSRLTGTA